MIDFRGAADLVERQPGKTKQQFYFGLSKCSDMQDVFILQR